MKWGNLDRGEISHEQFPSLGAVHGLQNASGISLPGNSSHATSFRQALVGETEGLYSSYDSEGEEMVEEEIEEDDDTPIEVAASPEVETAEATDGLVLANCIDSS